MVCRQGWSAAQVAQALGCSIRSVQLWVQKSRRGRRPAALRTGKAPGAKPKLDARKKQQLLKLLAAGPEAAGLVGQLWTGPRIAAALRARFGVSYHVRYLPTLLRSLGWSVQKPKRQALERHQPTVDAWVARDWPRLKKRPAASGPPSPSSTKPGS